jgi:hypothetical protein
LHQCGWNVPEHVPTIGTPFMVTVQGMPLMEIGAGEGDGLGLGDGRGDGDGDASGLGDGLGDGIADGLADGLGDGDAEGLGCGAGPVFCDQMAMLRAIHDDQ